MRSSWRQQASRGTEAPNDLRSSCQTPPVSLQWQRFANWWCAPPRATANTSFPKICENSKIPKQRLKVPDKLVTLDTLRGESDTEFGVMFLKKYYLRYKVLSVIQSCHNFAESTQLANLSPNSDSVVDFGSMLIRHGRMPKNSKHKRVQ